MASGEKNIQCKNMVQDETELPFKPDGFRARHLQIVLLFLGISIGYSQRVGLSVAIVAMTDPNSTRSSSERYEWDQGPKSMVLSSFFWGYVITQVPSGYLANVWSAQKVLVGGLLICSIANGLIPVLARYGDWLAVCVGRAIMGLSQACLLPCTQTLLARWCPPEERARLGTFAYAGAPLGIVIAMPISGLLAASRFGWPSIFYIFEVIGVLWAVLYYLFGADDPINYKFISNDEKRYILASLGRSDQNNQQKIKTPWLQIFTSVPMWALIIVHCCQNWGYWFLLTEIPSFLNSAVGYKIEDNGLVSALPYLAMWLLSFPVSWLSDYALTKGIKRAVIRKVSNSIAHWGPGIMLLLICFVDVRNQIVPVVILIVAVGLNAGTLCGFQINHIDLSLNHAGTMMSITNCISGIVSILAPLITGLIVTDETNIGQWHTVFYISSVIYFLGNLFFIIFGKAEVQWWNDPSAITRNTKRVYHITNA